MATIDLGKIKLVWRGTYDASTAYTVDDVVQHTDSGLTSSFICTTASTGNAPSTGGSVHSSWAYLAKGGTAGTDVGTTITTQGDILYRDGSGLQRLAKPASDKFLQNTSGGVLSWEAVSSDMVKLGEAEITSNVSSVAFENVCNSTYSMYKIFGSHIHCSSSQPLRLQFGYGSTPTYLSGSDYVWMAGAHYTNYGGGTNDFTWCDNHSTDTSISLAFSDDNNKTQGLSIEMLLTGFDPSLSTDPQVQWQKGGSSTSWWHQAMGGGWLNNSTARSNQITSVKLLRASGTFNEGKFIMYGIK